MSVTSIYVQTIYILDSFFFYDIKYILLRLKFILFYRILYEYYLTYFHINMKSSIDRMNHQ
jgi:hypothetical protein